VQACLDAIGSRLRDRNGVLICAHGRFGLGRFHSTILVDEFLE
jgi:hypothetical protein